MEHSTPTEDHAEEWRKILTEGHGPLVKTRWMLRYLPSPPRCKLCNSPFEGIGGRLARVAGFRRSRKNPNLCTRCCDGMPPGGAEIDIAVLFADARGSTGIGERESAADFAELLNRFYTVATDTLVRHDAVIDKLIGDEVMALFIQGISGEHYRRRAVEAGVDLLHALGYGTQEGPWLALGAAVNAGLAYVGNVGGSVLDFTALGDPVNVAARMQSEAASGELLVAAAVDGELAPEAERRTLHLRGRDAPVDAVVLSAES